MHNYLKRKIAARYMALTSAELQIQEKKKKKKTNSRSKKCSIIHCVQQTSHES